MFVRSCWPSLKHKGTIWIVHVLFMFNDWLVSFFSYNEIVNGNMYLFEINNIILTLLKMSQQ